MTMVAGKSATRSTAMKQHEYLVRLAVNIVGNLSEGDIESAVMVTLCELLPDSLFPIYVDPTGSNARVTVHSVELMSPSKCIVGS